MISRDTLIKSGESECRAEFSSDQGAKAQEYFVYFKLLQRRARRKFAGRRRSGIKQRFHRTRRRFGPLPALLALLAVLLSACVAEPDPIRLSPLSEPPPPGTASRRERSVRVERGEPVLATVPTPVPTRPPEERTEEPYVLNLSSKRFHRPSCSSVSEMKEKNRQDVTASREALMEQGYQPCGNCKP